MTIQEQIAEKRRILSEIDGDDPLASEPESDGVSSLSDMLNYGADQEESKLTAREVVTDVIPHVAYEGIKGIVSGPAAVGKFVLNTMFDPDEAEAQFNRGKESVEAAAYDMWQNPSHALPLAGMIAGGALGGAVGLPNVGAGLGALVGTQLQNEYEGTGWDKEKVGNVMLAPLGNVPFALGGALWRKTKGTERFVNKAKAVYMSTVLSPEQIELADRLIGESDALSEAKRELVHGERQRGVLGRLDHGVSTEDAVTMEQPTLPGMKKVDQMKQRPLFDKSLLGGRVSGRPKFTEPPTEGTVDTLLKRAEPANKQQLDLFKVNSMEQPELLIDAERMSQPNLFQRSRFGAKQGRNVQPRPDTVKPDLPNKDQMELFRPDNMEQADLFPARDRFAQQSLFANKGVHHTAGGEESVLTVKPAVTPREPGSRMAQPTMLPHKDKFKQLDLFLKKTRPRNGMPESETLTVPEAEQLELPLSRRLQPAPAMKEGATTPTALFRVAGDTQEQLSLDLRRRPGEAPVIDPGGEWRPTDLRDVKPSRIGADVELPLKRKRNVAGDMDAGPDLHGTHLTSLSERKWARTAEDALDLDNPKWEGSSVAGAKAAASQPELFAKAETAALHNAHVAERRRVQRVEAARATLASHVAETEARLVAERNIKADPVLNQVWEDERHLARLSVLEPTHLRPDVNPIVKAVLKAGMTASFANPHYALVHQMGAEGHWLSQNLMQANDLHVTAVEAFKQRAHALMDKYSVGEHDLQSHGFLHVLFEHGDLRDAMRAEGVAGIKKWEVATGNKLNVKPKDYARLHDMGKFADELKTQVHDPMWAFAMRRNADPRVLAKYNMRYMLPTFTSRRIMEDIEGDLASIKHAYNSLSDVDKSEAHGKLLYQQHTALSRKLAIAKKAADGQDKSRAAASQTLYKKGMKPGEVFSSALKDKHTDMMFGTGMRSNMDDHISGFLKKVIYDPVNKRVNGVIGAAPWDASTKRWATAFAMDQLGTRRQVQMTRLNDVLKRIPLLGRYVKEDTAERAINSISQWNAAVNIGLNPRFYPVNSTQILTMGYGLVGMDALAHGLLKVLTDWPNAYKRAVQNGAVQGGMHAMWKEEGVTARGNVITRFTKEALDKANKLPQASEAFNRTLMHEAGLWVAEKEKLKGGDALRRARDINRMANHGYSAAEHPTISGTLAGSVAARYKSFGMQYVSYVRHLAKTDTRAALETLAMVMALGGTAGIPMFGAVQGLMAKGGYDMPNNTPLDEAIGMGLAESFNPWPDIPGVTSEFTLENLAGPLLGPPAAGLSSAYEQDGNKTARGIGGILGAGIMRPIRAIDEYRRGGVTTTASGLPLMKRDNAAILKGALGLGPTAKGEAYKHNQNVRHALELGDTGKVMEAVRQAQIAGVSRPAAMLSSAQRMKTNEEKKKGFFDSLRGR